MTLARFRSQYSNVAELIEERASLALLRTKSTSFALHMAALPVIVPTNFFTDWLEDAANSLTDSFSKQRIKIVKQIATSSLPTIDALKSNWYLLNLGGTYGLAQKIIMAVIVILGLMVIVRPTHDHSKRIGRTVSSVLMLGIFGLVFFPVYSLLYGMSTGSSQSMIRLALGTQNQDLSKVIDEALRTILPEDIWMRVIVAFVGMLLSYAAYGVALLNYVVVGLTGLLYPVAVALRPLGEKANTLFHGANSAIATSLATPVVVVIGLLFPNLAEKILPGAAATGPGAGIFTVIGASISFAGPILIAIFAFKSSHEVFGDVRSNTSGSVDINSTPPLDTREMRETVRESTADGWRSYTTTVPDEPPPGEKSDGLMDDVRRYAANTAGAAATTATGNPATGYAVREGVKYATGNQSSGSETPSPESPIKEWPDAKKKQ